MRSNRQEGFEQPSRHLAMLYDAHHSRHREDLDFWSDIASRTEGPILELGCGTGRILLRLAHDRHRILGLDRNLAMLKVLQDRMPPNLVSTVDLVQADLTAYHLAEKFGLIFLACNTFSTLSRGERKQCLQRAHQHLKAGGQFVTSMPNPMILSLLPQHSDPEVEELFIDPESGDPVQVSSGWKRDESQFRLYWHYDRLLSNGSVKRLSVEMIHELNDSSTYLQEMRDCGLNPVDIYGDFDHSGYDKFSPHLIITAIR